MFHCFVTMKLLLRLLIIPCNILELSILRFVTISFEIMLLKVTLTSSMFILLGNVEWKTKNSTHTQDLSMEIHSNERGEYVYVPS